MGLRGQLPIELTNSLQILAVELYEYFKSIVSVLI